MAAIKKVSSNCFNARYGRPRDGADPLGGSGAASPLDQARSQFASGSEYDDVSFEGRQRGAVGAGGPQEEFVEIGFSVSMIIPTQQLRYQESYGPATPRIGEQPPQIMQPRGSEQN